MEVFGKEVRSECSNSVIAICFISRMDTVIYFPRCSLTESIPKGRIRESTYSHHLNLYYGLAILVYFTLHKRQSRFLYIGIRMVLFHILFAD